MRRLLSLSLSLLLLWGWADRPLWMSRAETITPFELQAHLEFIASDALEGRDTPSRGLDIAGLYIVSHLKRWGVKPAGENGTYFQTLNYRTDAVNLSETRLQIGGRTFEYGVGFVARPVPLNATAPLVYVGYGWSNPDKGVDPYAELDVQGKILVVQAGYPREVGENFENAAALGWRSPEQNALDKGALAIVRIDPTDMERLERIARAWSQRRAVEGLETMSRVPLIIASQPLLEAIFAGERFSAAELIQRANGGEPAPSFALSESKRLSITISARSQAEVARSVIGVIEGADPALKNEYVSLGAHLDHVGVASRGGADRIYNGADDNGSGCVALMEIAEAFATGPRPKRSILLLWYAGEEQGLLGSRLFVERPTVPLENIIVNINLDMVGRSKQPGDNNPRNRELSGPNEVYVIGPNVASPDIGKVLNRVNEQYLQMTLNPMYDSLQHPEQLFFRSDHFSFVSKGIPAVFFFTGLHEDYHQVTDSVEKIDFEKMARVARTVFGLAWALADAPERPARVNLNNLRRR
ncbi:MAG: M20/M25/M40 family metallo-hydrolase [Fimbriimonadales bacterium]|nr:M20/M25/M40 family metallo-hydrolase [Fimbriimonadales bacterium]